MIQTQKYIDLAFRNPRGCKTWSLLQQRDLKREIPTTDEHLDLERAIGVLIFELGFFPRRDEYVRVQKAQQALARERGLQGDTVYNNTLQLFMQIDEWLQEIYESVE